MKVWALDETLRSLDLNANFSEVAADIAAAQAAAQAASVPASAPGTTVATLTPSGVLVPAQMPLVVSDGTHTVQNAVSMTFTGGATVSGGNGQAMVALPAGGGGGGAGAFTRPPASAFAAYNWQAGTKVYDKPDGPFTLVANVQNGNYVQTYDAPLPQASNWWWATRVRIAQSNDSYIIGGITLRDSVSGGIVLIGGFQRTLGVFHWRDNANLANQVWGSSFEPGFSELDFLATDDGTNRSYSVSCDGILPLDDPSKCWLPIYTPQNRATFIVPDRVGVGMNENWGQGWASGAAMPVAVTVQQWLLKPL